MLLLKDARYAVVKILGAYADSSQLPRGSSSLAGRHFCISFGGRRLVTGWPAPAWFLQGSHLCIVASGLGVFGSRIELWWASACHRTAGASLDDGGMKGIGLSKDGRRHSARFYVSACTLNLLHGVLATGILTVPASYT